MLDIIFAHPPTTYDSYTDYRALAGLSEFENVTTDDIDVNRNVLYIVCPHNGDVEAALCARPKADRKCKVALWFLERPIHHGHEHFKARTIELLQTQAEYMLFSDRNMHALVGQVDGAIYVPMGSDERLGTLCDEAKHYDFCHMSYDWGRRSFIHNIPAKMGQNCWGQARHEVLTHSKFMLNVHQDEDPFIEPLRFALCAAYGIPLLTEYCADPFPFVPGEDFIMANIGGLEGKLLDMIKEDYNIYKPVGMRMFEKATKEYRFEDNLKKLACQIDSLSRPMPTYAPNKN